MKIGKTSPNDHKFIWGIKNGEIIFSGGEYGQIERHADIVKREKLDDNECLGGGSVIVEDEILFLFSQSGDYGYAELEKIRDHLASVLAAYKQMIPTLKKVLYCCPLSPERVLEEGVENYNCAELLTFE